MKSNSDDKRDLFSENLLSTEISALTIVVYGIENLWAQAGVGKSQRVTFPKCTFSLNCQVSFGNGINMDTGADDANHDDANHRRESNEEVRCGRDPELARISDE